MKNRVLLTAKKLFLVSAILISSGCSSDTNVAPEILKPFKIVAFGDSTTATRSTIEAVYTQRLPYLLDGIGIKNIVINAGVGGSHTGFLTDNSRHNVQHARDRFSYAVLGKSPDLVIISFGINDSWIDEGQTESRISLEKYEQKLRYMIDELTQKEVDIILLTPNAFGNRYESWRYERTHSYAEKVRTIASELNIILIDQWKMFEEYGAIDGQKIDDLLIDGMHPNDKWHLQLAEMLAVEITALIE